MISPPLWGPGIGVEHHFGVLANYLVRVYSQIIKHNPISDAGFRTSERIRPYALYMWVIPPVMGGKHDDTRIRKYPVYDLSLDMVWRSGTERRYTSIHEISGRKRSDDSLAVSYHKISYYRYYTGTAVRPEAENLGWLCSLPTARPAARARS